MERARSVIEEIFTHPPINEAELVQRLVPVDAKHGRRVLMEKLDQSLIDDCEIGLYVQVFSRFGVGEAHDDLVAIACDTHRDPQSRSIAIAVLTEEDPDLTDIDLDFIDSDEFTQMADLPIVEMMHAIEMDPDVAEEVTDLLLETPDEMREFVLSRLGHCRRQAGVSAAVVYDHSLRSDRLASLHPLMIDALVEEGGPESAALLQELRDSTTDGEKRRYLQGGLMRIGTKAIDPKHEIQLPAGNTYVSSCDGQGAFFVLGCFKRPNGSMTVANLCIRASGDLRDGYVLNRQIQRDIKTLMTESREGAGCEFASVSFQEASAIVDAAVQRTKALNLSIPNEARSAIKLFEQLNNVSQENVMQIQPARRVTITGIRKLLKKPIYQYWFFDLGDLISSNIHAPACKKPSVEWYKNAAVKLNTRENYNRLLAMAKHMARWHSWRGDQEQAGLCEAVARSIEKNFNSSPLVRVMLERSVLMNAHSDEEEDVSLFGDPVIRQYLKSRFFKDVESPKGFDLALLDFAEAALMRLETALLIIPGDRQPRDDEKATIAYAIARTARKIFIDSGGKLADYYIEKLAIELKKVCRLNKRERVEIASQVVVELLTFVQEVCCDCHLDCIENPWRDVADVFFSPRHPVEYLEDSD